MDAELSNLISRAKTNPSKERIEARINFDGSDVIEVPEAHGTVQYKLKPLPELYGTGLGGTVDPESDEFMPLFLAIEQEIVDYYGDHPELTDAQAGSVLGALGMSPEAPTTDELATRLQITLRFILSVNDYSRQEVRQALRKIHKSVDRHSRIEGRRGYLDFITEHFGNAE